MFPLQARNGDAIRVTYYPDHTPLVTATDATDLLVLRPTNLGEILGGLFWCDAQRMRGRPVKHLVIPLMPGSRQDRLNAAGDQLFTLKAFAEMVNARQFETVSVLDPHSDVTPALLTNVRVWPAYSVIPVGPFGHGDYTAVIAPDAGAAKRADMFARALGCGVVQASKRRDLTTGQITGYDIPDISPDGVYLVVDDLCDGGATFLALAASAGGSILDLYVSHGLFTHGTAKLLQHYRHIYCTDSTITTTKYGVTVLPMIQEMVNASV